MLDRRLPIDPNARFVRLGGRPPRITMALLIAQLAVFLLFVFADAPTWLTEHLALSASKALGLFEVWQPVTALWIHLGLRSLVFDLVVLWLFGSALERWWGGRRFAVFWGVTGVVGLVVGMLVGMAKPTALMAGSQGSAVAMLIASAIIFPAHLIHLRTIIPIKATLVCLLMVGFVLLGGVISRLWLDIAIQLGGGLAAVAFLGPRRLIQQWRVKRMKKKLHVIGGGKNDSGPYLN
ncbi:MAG: hypothetical protein CSA65_08780 [Proteobacteria bacterium]|nr:MAG: hypothetical protein CSA65_08780 [Pseudomonadota bacterium]